MLIQNRLGIHVIDIVSKVVHSVKTLILAIEYIVSTGFLNSILPILPEFDILIDSLLGSFNASQSSSHFLE